MTKPDTAYRLLALFRYWNIIHFFFPYKYAINSSNRQLRSRLTNWPFIN